MRGHGASIDGAGGRLLVGAVVAALVVGACGAGASPSAVSGPDRVKAAGTLVWCSDPWFPPYSSTAAGGPALVGTEAVGLDIDIAAEVAKRLGVTSRINPTDFDSILSSLDAGKCDLVIAAMTSTVPGRAEKADFVDYLRTWTGFLVATGNPKGIRTVEDLAGKSVVVAPDDPLSAPLLQAASVDLVAAGKLAIDIVTGTESAGKTVEQLVEELAAGQVDALAGDSTLNAYYVDKPPYAGASEIGGPLLDPQPLGIAVRKDDAGMKEAVAAAIDAMYADGTMQAIVAKWGLTDAVDLLK
jgi:polar amino acid transport system substrate-binding protein